MWLPLTGSGQIRSTLLALLEKLPPLRYPMSTEQEDEFIRGFLLLDPEIRPNWIPVLLQAGNIERDQHRRHTLFGQLRDELERDSDFHLFDEHHRPSNTKHEAFLDVDLAKRILRKRGLFEKVAALAAARPELTRLDTSPTPCSAEMRYPGFPKSLLLEGTVSDEWRIRAMLNLYRSLPTQVSDKVLEPAPGEASLADREQEEEAARPCRSEKGDQLSSHPARTKSRKVPLEDPTMDQPASPAPDCGLTHNTHTSSPAPSRSAKLLSVNEVAERIGKGRSTVYNRLDETHPSYDKDFPQPRRVGPRETLAWLAHEVEAYILSRPA